MTVEPWPLPESWHWSTFAAIARVASDLVDPKDYPNHPHIAPNHIERETGRLLPFVTIAEDGVMSAKHRFSAGQILYSKIRPYLAKVVVVDFDGLCSADMYPVDTELDPRFLKWWMLTREFTRQAAGQQARTILPKINKRALGLLPVPVAPHDEQRRIVDILEDHLSRLDAALASLTRSATAVPVLSLSVLSDVRRSLLDSSAPLKPLGAVCDTALGKMLDAKKARGTPTPYLRNISVRWGSFDLTDVKTVPLSDAERTKLEVKPGDLLVCEGGEPGRCAVWTDGPTGMTYQKALHRVRAKDPSRVTTAFVALLLEEFIRTGRADRMFTGTTIKHLPQEKLRIIELPIPDLATQYATVDRLNKHVQAMVRITSELVRVASQGAALRRALLDAAFSGRVTDMEMVEEMAGV